MQPLGRAIWQQSVYLKINICSDPKFHTGEYTPGNAPRGCFEGQVTKNYLKVTVNFPFQTEVTYELEAQPNVPFTPRGL